MGEMTMETIIVNGKTFVEVPAKLSDFVIVRTFSAGVHFGVIESRDGKEVVLKNAIRFWYWDGAASLSQLAVDGVTKPQNCKFSVEVPKIILTEAIEIIPCSEKAAKCIREVPTWKV
jgi:hypothetical protein